MTSQKKFFFGKVYFLSDQYQIMATKRRQQIRQPAIMSNRNVNKLVDGTVNIATAYTVGMVGISMLGALKK